MSNSMVSVIIPTHNNGNWIGNSIISILKQDYKCIEVIIIDDLSTDNTSQIVRMISKKDNRLRYYRTSKRIYNVATLLNIGIKLSKGNIIARQDADDISLRKRVKKQVEFLEQKDAYIVGTWFYILLPNGELIKDWRKIQKIYSSFNNDIKLPLHGTWLFKRNLVEKVGMYNENFPFAQDFEFFLRISTKYRFKIYILPEYLYLWRLHNHNVSVKNRDERQKYIEEAKKLWIEAKV